MDRVLLSSNRHDWRTPAHIFKALHQQYQFTVDAAASAENSLLPFFWDVEADALRQDWSGHRVWCNPPYGRKQADFIRKAFEEWQTNAVTTVLLIPARPDTRAWQKLILPNATVSFLSGRLRFLNHLGEATEAAPFPSAIVVFDGWKRALDPIKERTQCDES